MSDYGKAFEDHPLVRGARPSRPDTDDVKAIRTLIQYCDWTVGPESPGHHPTMPSAIGAARVALDRLERAAAHPSAGPAVREALKTLCDAVMADISEAKRRLDADVPKDAPVHPVSAFLTGTAIHIGKARAALSAPSGPSVEDIERQTIERCAKVAETFRISDDEWKLREIANAIRSLTQTGEK